MNNSKPSIKDISKNTGFQYLHTLNVLKQFQKEKLIRPIFNKEEANHKQDPGNPYIVELTLKGRTVHAMLDMLNRLHQDVPTEKIINEMKLGVN